MEAIATNYDFSNPEEVLKILTSEQIDYSKLIEYAQKLVELISDLHVNQDERKFQAITQCILECYTKIYNFKSKQWISETKLLNELKPGEKALSFTRINAKNEVCLYKIVNYDQINFDKEIEYADEFEVVKRPNELLNKKETKSEEDDVYLKVLTLLQNGENVFLTGFAGTGKSYILGKLKDKFKKKLTITSTTGLAAVNVKGQTLHSWAGVGLCKNPVHKTVEKIRTRKTQLRQILNCKILAVDEISMLNIEAFEYINQVLMEIKESSEPFGGIQVIFIGDFFQLPPVEKDLDIPKRYCFDSDLWNDLNLKNVILKKNYRQNQEGFINALAHMRTNCLDAEDIELLNSRCVESDTYQTDMLHIFSTNEEANRYNSAKFNMIEEPARVFMAQDGVYRGNKLVYDDFTESENYILEIFSKNCRADRDIVLKLGARVMLLVNMDFNKGLINGACGSIQRFNESGISIKFDNGLEATIPKHKFEYYYNDRVVAERLQYPLKLAYGITIHKSQGMTLDKLVVDCSRIFERGQAYVAMSRVKTLEGLFIKSFSEEKVMVDSHVAEFYENLQEAENVTPNFRSKIFEEDEKKEQLKEADVRETIKSCIEEFSGQYGKNGFVKILTGSQALKDSEYNSKIIGSRFFGALSSMTQKAVGQIIEDLVTNGEITIKKISFGRPVLCK